MPELSHTTITKKPDTTFWKVQLFVFEGELSLHSLQLLSSTVNVIYSCPIHACCILLFIVLLEILTEIIENQRCINNPSATATVWLTDMSWNLNCPVTYTGSHNCVQCNTLASTQNGSNQLHGLSTAMSSHFHTSIH